MISARGWVPVRLFAVACIAAMLVAAAGVASARAESYGRTLTAAELQPGGGASVREFQTVRRASRQSLQVRGVSLAGVYAPLAAKARQIAGDCGSTVISGVRHTKVAGTRKWSLHDTGHAVDMQGNPACIYAHLSGWPGGYSTDYARVRHVHISLGGSEDGRRFAHYIPRYTRLAQR